MRVYSGTTNQSPRLQILKDSFKRGHISGEFPGLLLDVVEDGADLGPGGHGGEWVGCRVWQTGRYLEAGARPRLLRTGAVIPECQQQQDVQY